MFQLDEINNIMINSLSDDALNILDALNNNGFESFAVGGCVRDCLLGLTPKDEDITTNAKPEEVRKVFKDLGYSVIDTGLKHGTVTVMINDIGYEITTYRSDGEYSDGRHPDSVIFETNIDKDLERRDFTINAMAWSKKDGFKDNFNGLEDIQKGVIRAVGNADDRFKEDALRMMRAIRFSAKYGFEIDDEVINAIKDNASLLENVSMERINNELTKTLMSEHPEYVKKFHETGLMKEFLPEVDCLFKIEQNTIWHKFNVGDHTIEALKNAEEDKNIRLAILLHDTGKAKTKTTELNKNGEMVDHFLGHADISAEISDMVLRRLKFTSKEIKEITKLVKFHDSLNSFIEGIDGKSDNKINKHIDKSLRKFLIDSIKDKSDLSDEFFEKIKEVIRCDSLGQNIEYEGIQKKIEMLPKLNEGIDRLLAGPHKIGDLNISGNELKSIGLEGKQIHEMQISLLNYVMVRDDMNTEEKLLKFAESNKKDFVKNDENSIEF